MEIKSCNRCKQDLPIDHFELLESGNLRQYCKHCRTDKKNISISESPKKFLKNLFVHLRSSRIKTVEWGLDIEDLHELWEEQGGRCAMSNVHMTWKKGDNGSDFNVSIDRITPNGPYIKTNVQLVCYRINIMKHVISDNELYWWCKNVVETKEDYDKE